MARRPPKCGNWPICDGPAHRRTASAPDRARLPDKTGGFRTTSEDANLRLAHIEIGFVAVATPSLGKVLEEAARTGFRRVIVQPHLLFAGSVLAEIHRLVERQQLAEAVGANSGRQWIVTEALGPDRRLVTAVVDIVSGDHPPDAWVINQNQIRAVCVIEGERKAKPVEFLRSGVPASIN